VVYRVTTVLENLEMSANIAVFREMSVNLLISRKCWKYQGKISGFVREKYFVKNKT